MWIEEQPSPESGIQSLTEAVAMPREFRAHTNNSHFYKSTEKVMFLDFYRVSLFLLQRTYKYSVFEVHDVEWEQPEVGTTGSVGAVLISKVISMENRKNYAIPIISVVLLEEVKVDVMPDGKFIVYHMKAYMDQRISD